MNYTNSFHPGDLVKCVDAEWSDLHPGYVYTVRKVWNEYIELFGIEGDWRADRFESDLPAVPAPTPAPKPRYRARNITEISVDGGKTWIEAEHEYQTLSISGTPIGISGYVTQSVAK